MSDNLVVESPIDITPADPGIDTYVQLVSRALLVHECILMLGSSGSGKNTIIEQVKRRVAKRLSSCVEVSCAGLTGDVFRSQLFGHTVGAYSGSRGSKPGAFRAAQGGFISFDELGTLKGNTQAQNELLRALDGWIQPVGSDQAIMLEQPVRAVSSTNEDIFEYVRQEVFRKDLLFRLAPVYIRISRLEERRDDIVTIAVAEFERSMRIGKIAGDSCLTAGARRALRSLDYPSQGRGVAARVRVAIDAALGPIDWESDALERVVIEAHHVLGGQRRALTEEEQGIVDAVRMGTHRHGELVELLDIAERTLTRRLVRLREDGFLRQLPDKSWRTT